MTDLFITLTHHESDENNVTLAFSMGIKALEKGHTVDILLLSHGVHLAEKGYGDKIDIGAPFEPVKSLIPAFVEMGGKVKVCSACVEHNNVDKNNLIDGAEMIKSDDVIDILMESKKSLQLN